MRHLALDLGTKLGYAHIDTGRPDSLSSGLGDFSRQGGEEPGHRYRRYRRWLIGKFNEVKPAAAWYERVYRHEGTDAAHVYGGFQALLEELCAEPPSVRLTGIPVQTIKFRATTSGNAGKERVLQAARAKWPRQKILDHNQADALWILRVGLNVTAGRLVLPATTKATRKRAKKRQMLLKIIS